MGLLLQGDLLAGDGATLFNRVAFRFLSPNQDPDNRAIARLGHRHIVTSARSATCPSTALASCAEAGLVKLGRVALDATKLRASASRHKTLSFERLGTRLGELEAAVEDFLP